jgi:hypothetical protein
MYFSLPSRDDAKGLQLDAVYYKWNLEIWNLLRARKGIIEWEEVNRKRRLAQRLSYKRRKVVDVYEVCNWRPLVVSYMPSYLDWEM